MEGIKQMLWGIVLMLFGLCLYPIFKDKYHLVASIIIGLSFSIYGYLNEGNNENKQSHNQIR